MLLFVMRKMSEFLKENWVLVLSFLYIVSPIDIIPGDFVTGVGLIDDLGVLLLTGGYMFIKFLMVGQGSKGEGEQKRISE